MPLRISIVTCSYNTPLHLWKKCLQAIASQTYPRRYIEHTVMDAGSNNGSVAIAKKYGCKVVVRPDLLQYSQKRMSIGISKSSGDIILFLEPDNIVPDPDWLYRMVEPFSDPAIIGTFSMHNTYTRDMSSLSVYFSLIGANDPLLLYLGKSEKNPIYKQSYRTGHTLYENSKYAAVQFTPDNLPTLGDNGHMVRKDIIDLVNNDSNSFIHVDAFYQLAKKHYDTYGVVKNSIIHDNCSDNDVIKALAKRVEYKEKFTNRPFVKRSYLVFNRKRPEDIMRLFIFIVSGLTVYPMVLFSIVGYIRHPNRAWFFHPVVCFVEVWMYALSEIRMLLYNRTYDK